MPPSEDVLRSLKQHVCLYASFDQTANADFSRGKPNALLNSKVARHLPNGGRFGGCLQFTARDHAWAEDECVFAATRNFPYDPDGFSGTISLWLKGDPDADLDPKFPVDPFHISRHAADGSFYLDLTRHNDDRYGSPRKLRFGMYGDSARRDKFYGGQLVVIGELGWQDRKWHHIVATWENANTAAANMRVYLDGKLRGWMEELTHKLTWDLDQLKIGLGQRYVGEIDEFLILDKALTADEVAALTAASEPLGAVWRELSDNRTSGQK